MRRADAAVLIALAAGAFLFWEARVIAPGHVREGLAQIDLYTLTYPMARYGFGEIAAGRLPLWNPYSFCGIPFLATLYTGVLYPGNFLFLLLPTGLAMGLTAALHTFLAAAFFYLLGRAWSWSRTAAAAGAIVWAFSQNAVWFYGPLGFISSAAWIPLMALGIERACARRGPAGGAILAFAGAMSLLAGGLQVFVYGAYALALFAAARLWRVAAAQGVVRAVVAAVWIAAGAASAAAFAAPQILPSLELAERTPRAPGKLPLPWADNPIVPALPRADAGAPSLGRLGETSGGGIASAISRTWLLTPRGMPAFCFGVLAPLLAAAALFGRRRALALALLAGALVTAVLSLGVATPLYALYHALPTGAWFRNPNRFALLTSAALACLAGLGIDALLRRSSRRPRAFAAAIAAALAGGAIALAAGAPLAVIGRTLAVAAAGLAALYLSSAGSTRALRIAGRAALIAILFLELGLAYRNPYVHPQRDPKWLDARAEVARTIQERAGSYRTAVVDQEWGSFGVQRKFGLLHRVRVLNDFEPLAPAEYATLFRLLDNAPPEPLAPFDGRLRLDPARSNKHLLDLLSVRYVIVDRDLYPAWDAGARRFGLERIPLGDREITLYENPAARPRATLISDGIFVETREEAARVMTDPEFDPRRVAVLQSARTAALLRGSTGLRRYTIDGWKAKGFGPVRAAPGTARILVDEPDHVEIVATVAPRRAAWLVLMDLDYPGWKATVNGAPATILRANLVGRALGLDPGTHRVIFRYESPTFHLGCLIALVAACVWAFGALLRRAAGRGMSPGHALRRVIPWAVAGAILVILVRRAGIDALREALSGADLPLLLGASVLCTIPMYLLDCLTVSRVVTWFNLPITLREIAPVKAAVYVINVVNYNAGSGAIALWLRRMRGVPFLEAASSILFVNVVDAAVLVAFMAAGLAALDPPIDRGVAILVACAGAAFAGHLLYWRGGFDFLVLGRVRNWPIFKSFREAPLSRYLALAAIRVPFDLLFIVNNWIALRAFGIDVPFLKVLAFVPLISFIAVVPITVSGLGTVQAATVYLLRPYAPEAKILAFSLALTVALNGIRALIGLPFFRRVTEDLFRGKGGNDG